MGLGHIYSCIQYMHRTADYKQHIWVESLDMHTYLIYHPLCFFATSYFCLLLRTHVQFSTIYPEKIWKNACQIQGGAVTNNASNQISRFSLWSSETCTGASQQCPAVIHFSTHGLPFPNHPSAINKLPNHKQVTLSTMNHGFNNSYLQVNS